MGEGRAAQRGVHARGGGGGAKARGVGDGAGKASKARGSISRHAIARFLSRSAPAATRSASA